jgi:hypothetical protein
MVRQCFSRPFFCDFCLHNSWASIWFGGGAQPTIEAPNQHYCNTCLTFPSCHLANWLYERLKWKHPPIHMSSFFCHTHWFEDVLKVAWGECEEDQFACPTSKSFFFLLQLTTKTTFLGRWNCGLWSLYVCEDCWHMVCL